MEENLKNYYEVLEIPINATYEQIHQGYLSAKNAYSNESLAFYSLMTKDNCQDLLELVEEAYIVLSDPQKRKEYDQRRGLNVSPPPPPNGGPANTSVSSSLANILSINDKMLESGSSSNSAASRETDIVKLVAQKRFSLHYDVKPEIEQEIEQTTEHSGAFLKKVREYKSVDLVRMSEMTKISKTYIKNIEEENYAALPAPVYVRGFVFQMAKCLKLDPNTIANSFVQRMKKALEPPKKA
ncbi:MAG: helix-turn-helix domain-containing protein [Pseudomonadota bacterium]